MDDKHSLEWELIVKLKRTIKTLQVTLVIVSILWGATIGLFLKQ